MRLNKVLKYLVCFVLWAHLNSCGNDQTSDHLLILSSISNIYDGQGLTIDFEHRFSSYQNLKAWAVIKGTSFKSVEYILTQVMGNPPYNSSIFLIVPGPDDDPRLTDGGTYDLCIRAGTNQNNYEESCIYVTYSTSYIPPQDRINNIEFGESDIGNDGFLENTGITFVSPMYEIYYAVEFNVTFPERTKIRKTWRRAGQTSPVISAIQIVEESDNKIWGVFKRYNSAPLEPGTYTLSIEEYSLNGAYNELTLENGTGSFIIIE